MLARKVVRPIKKLLIKLLPRDIIDRLKELEAAFYRKVHSISYLCRRVFWFKKSLVFVNEKFEIGPFSINKKKPKELVFRNLEPGMYELWISHNDKFLRDDRRSFYVSFDILTSKPIKSKHALLQLPKRETATGYHLNIWAVVNLSMVYINSLLALKLMRM